MERARISLAKRGDRVSSGASKSIGTAVGRGGNVPEHPDRASFEHFLRALARDAARIDHMTQNH